MKHSLRILVAAGGLVAASAHADTLNFEGLPPDDIGTTVLVLPNATVTGSGVALYNLSYGFGTGNGGAICSYSGTSGCAADMQIDFDDAVSSLTFRTFGYNPGDTVEISAYAGASLLGSLLVSSNLLVDFSALPGITRLVMDDSSTGFGFAYGEFSFTPQGFPEPASHALVLAGLVAAGTLARRGRTG